MILLLFANSHRGRLLDIGHLSERSVEHNFKSVEGRLLDNRRLFGSWRLLCHLRYVVITESYVKVLNKL